MIENADVIAGTRGRRVALACAAAGIEAARPDAVVPATVALDGDTLRVGPATVDVAGYDEIVVVGGGKAAGGLAAALEAVLGDAVDGGVIVAPAETPTRRIEVAVGDHPLPSDRSVAGTQRVLERVEAAGERTLVLAVVTGGGSALLEAPVAGVTLEDIQAVTADLLRAGAPIEAVNAVRGCLSRVKAGGLARAAAPARVVGLVLSDVVGDDLRVVASGPTVPDEIRPREALAVLDRYGVDAPDRVRGHLAGIAPDDAADDGSPVTNVVLANAMTAIRAARDEARRRGYEPCILSSRLRGEARVVGGIHRDVATECLATGNPVAPPAVLVSGGETTVTVRGDGTGGPNLEFAVAAGIDLAAGVTVVAVDTDGSDGSTAVAGGIVDHTTVTEPPAARRALDDNDAYAYLEARSGLVRTGATGTNVNDLRVVVVEAT